MSAHPKHIYIIRRDGRELLLNGFLSHRLGGLKFRRPIAVHFRVTIRKRKSSRTGVVGGREIRNLVYSQVEQEFTIVNAVIPLINEHER
jgi:hypothetical protein